MDGTVGARYRALAGSEVTRSVSELLSEKHSELSLSGGP